MGVDEIYLGKKHEIYLGGWCYRSGQRWGLVLIARLNSASNPSLQIRQMSVTSLVHATRRGCGRAAVVTVLRIPYLWKAVSLCRPVYRVGMNCKLERHYTVFSIHSSLGCNGIGRLSEQAVRSLVVISQSAYSRVRTSADGSHVASHFIGGKVSCTRS